MSDFFAKGCSFYAQAGERIASSRRSWLVLITKWHAETLQQRVALRVIGRGGDNCYLQAANLIYLIVLNFREDDLLAQAEAVVAATIERAPADATEVAQTRQRQVYQPIQEIVHAHAA